MSVQSDITRLVDVFAASDGGVDLVNFKSRMEALEERAAVGDPAASELLVIMGRFIKLVDVILQ